jgi:hypothetical protein
MKEKAFIAKKMPAQEGAKTQKSISEAAHLLDT